MTANELAALHVIVGAQRDQLSERLQKFAAAPIDAPSDDETAAYATPSLNMFMGNKRC